MNRQKLIDTPFAPLVQQYQQCYDAPSDVFLTQLGVTWSNIGIITPFFVIAFLGLIIGYQRFTGNVIPTAYSKKERDEVLNALAISLLLARDRIKVQKFGTIDEIAQLERNDSTFRHAALQQLIADLEADAEYHLNTYKLDDKIQQIRVDWKQLGQKLYGSTLSPLTASFGSSKHLLDEKNRSRDAVTAVVLEGNNAKKSSFELTELDTSNRMAKPPMSRSNSLTRRGSRREEILVLNRDASVENARSVGFQVNIENKRDILQKLDELYDKIQQVSLSYSLYSHHSERSSTKNDYEPYFQATGFLKEIDRSLTQLYEVLGRLSNISIDSDDDEEDSPRVPIGEFLNEFFEKVYQLLMLHTSIVMNCASEEYQSIRERYGDKVAYDISGTILTINDLFKRNNLNQV